MGSRSDNLTLEDLLLDGQNPRLPTTVSRSQSDMLLYIARTTSIAEIMSAIAQNDYFPGEPLVVIPAAHGQYVVVEGNRRLTALKLLHDPDQYPGNRRVHEISNSAIYKPASVPCVIFDTRAEVVNYLGYRHITGVKQWEPLAKARYIGNYFDELTEPSAATRSRYLEVARGIGSQSPYIKRQLDALAIYNVLEEHSYFNIQGLDEENISFSLLSTALGYESVLSFVSNDPDPYVNPSCILLARVEQLSNWMFKQDSKGATALGESRNIQHLALILDNHDATAALIGGASFARAYSLTRGLNDDFTEILSSTEASVTQAASMVAIIELDDSHRGKITNIFKQARLLSRAAEDSV